MKRIPTLLLAFFIALFSFAQQRQADSLEIVLKRHQASDTSRGYVLVQLATLYKELNPDKGMTYADEAASIANKHNDPFLLAKSKNAKAVNLLRKSENDKALVLLNEARMLVQDKNREADLASIYGNIASVYFQKADYATAAKYDAKTEAIYRRLNDSTNLLSSLNNIGTDYLLISDFVQTYKYLQEEQKLAEARNDTAALTNIYANFVEVYNGFNDFENSMINAEKALSLARKTGNKYLSMAMTTQIGQIYYFSRHYPEALKYLDEVAGNPELANYEPIQAFVYNTLGSVYTEEGHYKIALENLEKAKTIYAKSGDKLNLCVAVNKIGNIYSKVPDDSLRMQGIAVDNRLQTALSYQKQAIAYAEETGAIQRSGEMYEDISRVYKQMGRFTEALTTFEKGAMLKDSLLSDDNRKKLAYMEVRYQFDKKEDSLNTIRDKEKVLAAVRLAEQKTINTASILVSLVILLAGLVSFRFYKRRREAIVKQQQAETEQQLNETRLKAVRSQLNPHFIYHSLTSINYYIDREPHTATAYTTKFSELMREILENSEHEQITLDKELKTAATYMQLESWRLDNKVSCEIIIDKQIEPDNTLTLPLLFQPFLENSIIHGFKNGRENGKIIIRIDKDKDMLKCKIEDDGTGFPVVAGKMTFPTTSDKKSFGIKLTEERIQIMNKMNSTNGKIDMYNLPQGGGCVEIMLPFKTEF